MSKIAAAALAILLVGPASVSASTARFVQEPDGGQGPGPAFFEVSSTAGEAVDLTVVQDGAATRWRVSDAAGTVTPGRGCRNEGGDVICDSATAFPSLLGAAEYVDLDGGPGDDRISYSGITRASLAGAAGNDRLTAAGGGGRVTMGGGEGADELLAAGDGEPVGLDGGPGPDSLKATPSRPGEVAYPPPGVSVTVDGVANDGAPGEGDNVEGNIVSITGSKGDDTLVAGPTTFRVNDGAGGNDQIRGNALANEIVLSGGSDTVDGGDGDDTISAPPVEPGALNWEGQDGDLAGGAGSDLLSVIPPVNHDDFGRISIDGLDNDLGGANVHDDIERVYAEGNGHIAGSDRADVISAPKGFGIIDGRGGDDWLSASGQVIGGPGRDHLTLLGLQTSVQSDDGEVDTIVCNGNEPNPWYADPFDIAPNCAPGIESTTVTPSRVRVDRRGYIKVAFTCSRHAGIPCAGSVVLKGGSGVVARGRYAGSRAAKIKLSSRVRRSLGRKGKVFKVTATTVRTHPPASRAFELGRVRALPYKR